MTPTPTEAVRRFELDLAADASDGGRLRELHILGGLHALQVAITLRIGEVVQMCREKDASWSEIAATLQVSKQAAHERFCHRRSDPSSVGRRD